MAANNRRVLLHMVSALLFAPIRVREACCVRQSRFPKLYEKKQP